MVKGREWTGFEAVALQEAMRRSIRDFAAMLGIDSTTIANWRSGLGAVTPRSRMQEILDTTLEHRATPEDRARFEQIVAEGEKVWRERHARSGARKGLPLESGPYPQGAGTTPAAPGSVVTSAPLEDCQVSPDLRTWIEMHRRDLLQLFGGVAYGLPAVASILAGLDAEERRRIEKVLISPSRVDARAINDIETGLRLSLAQNDRFGPLAVLQMVQGQIRIAEALLRECPTPHEQRLWGLHGALSQLAGWMYFDLWDFGRASRHLEDARRSAHRARYDAMASLALCNLAYLEVWSPRGDPRMGIDHAVAAQTWARRSDDGRLEAYATQMAAYTFAANDQLDDCLTALDAADEMIAAVPDSDDTPSVAYFAGPGLAASIRSDCLHQLGNGAPALRAAQGALAAIDPDHARNHALAHLDTAHAYTDLGEIEAAATSITESARVAVTCRSDRLTLRIRRARAGLDRWSTTAPVRALDDQLIGYGFDSARSSLM